MEQFSFPMRDQETSEAMKKYVQKAIMELHHARKPDHYSADTNRQHFKIQNHGNVKDYDRWRSRKMSNVGLSDGVREFFSQKIVPFPRRFREAVTRTLNGRKILDRTVCNTASDECRNSMSANLNRALLELYSATRKSQLANNNSNAKNIKYDMTFNNIIRNKNHDSGDYGMVLDVNINCINGDNREESSNTVMNDNCDSDIYNNSNNNNNNNNKFNGNNNNNNNNNSNNNNNYNNNHNNNHSSNNNNNNKNSNDEKNNDGIADNDISSRIFDTYTKSNVINVILDGNNTIDVQISNNSIVQSDNDIGENRDTIIMKNDNSNNLENDNQNYNNIGNINSSDNNIYSTISNNIDVSNTVVSCKLATVSNPPVIENTTVGATKVTKMISSDMRMSAQVQAPPVPMPFTLHMSRNAAKKKKIKIQSKDSGRSRNQLRRISKKVGKHFTRAYKRWNKCKNKYSRMTIRDDEIEEENLLNDEFQSFQHELEVVSPVSPIFASRQSTNFPTTTVQGRQMSQQVRIIDVVKRDGQNQNHQNHYQDILDSSMEVVQAEDTKNHDKVFRQRRAPNKQQMPLLIGCGALSKGKAVLDMSKKIRHHMRKAPKKWRRRCVEKWNRGNSSQLVKESHHQNKNPMNVHVNDALKDLYRVAKPTIMFANAMPSEGTDSREVSVSQNVYAAVEACPWASHRTRASQVIHHSNANNYVTLHRNTRPAVVSRNQSSGSMFEDFRTNMRMVDKKRKECSGFIRRQCSFRKNNEVRLLDGF